MDLQDMIGYLIHRTDTKLTNYFTDRLKPFDVTPEQWSVIVVLDKDRGMTQKDLVEASEKGQTTLVRMINSMEKKGMVKKVYNQEDRRSHLLYLTDKGSKIKSEILPVVKDAHESVTKCLSDAEVQQLKTFLNKMYDAKL